MAGSRVRVSAVPVTARPVWVVGVVTAMDSAALTLRPDRQPETPSTFPFAELTRLEISRGQRSHVGQGIALGLFAGMALGAAVGAALYQPEDGTGNGDFDRSGYAVIGAAVGVPVGIIVGAVLGANARSDRWEPIALRPAER